MTAHHQTINKLAPAQPTMDEVFAAQQEACQYYPYPSYAERANRLKRLKNMIITNKDALAAAISKDFGNRSQDETLMFDVMLPVQYINYNLKHMKRWMKPQRRHLGLHMQPAGAKVIYQPLALSESLAHGTTLSSWSPPLSQPF